MLCETNLPARLFPKPPAYCRQLMPEKIFPNQSILSPLELGGVSLIKVVTKNTAIAPTGMFT